MELAAATDPDAKVKGLAAITLYMWGCGGCGLGGVDYVRQHGGCQSVVSHHQISVHSCDMPPSPAHIRMPRPWHNDNDNDNDTNL